MRIFDPIKAVEHRPDIKAAIFRHAECVVMEGVPLESLDLSAFGIRLDHDDFSLARSERWTKKKMTAYREEIVILSGLWRSIAVRTNSKKREQRYWMPENKIFNLNL